MKKQKAVGLEINANHIRPVRSGIVTGITKAVALGKSVHVWNIEIFNEAGKMNCVSRLTTAVVNLKEDEKEKNIKLVDSLLSS
jgi:1,4-dihydroxy-2-naphthoyl-CoA hydrolase